MHMQRRGASVALILCAVSAAAPVERKSTAFEYTQVHMGLPVRVVLHAPGSEAARRAATAAFARIAILDQMMSDYRPDSELRRLEGRIGQWIPISVELYEVVHRALQIAESTEGAFDPSIGPLVALWRTARQTGRLPDPPSVEAARASVGWRDIRLDAARRAIRLERAGMRLDLGGIAKGYILQEARRILRSHDVTRALIESGGDIVVGDAPPGTAGWKIHTGARDSGFADRASRLVNAAMATSGPTFQSVEIEGLRYSHVIDPRTGLGVTSPVIARVIADDAATADGLATALTILGEERVGAIRERFPGVMVDLTKPSPSAGPLQPADR
jgi:FAD:protein FMN transferase